MLDKRRKFEDYIIGNEYYYVDCHNSISQSVEFFKVKLLDWRTWTTVE